MSDDLMKSYTSEIIFNGKKLKLIWDGVWLYVESTANLAKIVSVNNYEDSPYGNVGIEFHYDA